MAYPSEPPTPKALSDDELNAKVLELQSQPGGLEQAMKLIEEQSLVRQQDALALAGWQLEDQMRRASEPAKPVIPEPSPAPIEPDPIENLTEPAAPGTTSKASESWDPKAISSSEEIDQVVASLNATYAASTLPSAIPDESKEESPAPVAVANEVIATEETLDAIEPEPEPIPATGSISVVSVTAEIEVNEEQSTQSQIIPDRPTTKPASLVWSWLALGSSPLVVIFAALLKSSGTSFAQALLLLAFSLFSISVLSSVGAVAAKRGSSSLSVISRSSFGVWGNGLPSLLILMVKLIWLASLIVLAARWISPLVSNQPWFAELSKRFIFTPDLLASALIIIPMLVVSALLAGFGGITILRAQQFAVVLAVIAIACLGYFVFTSYSLASLQLGSGLGLVDLANLAILVMAIFGFTVFSQSGDFARKLPNQTPGSKVFFLSFVSSFFLPLVVGVLSLAWFFMEPEIGESLLMSPLPAVAGGVPIWAFVAFTVALGTSALYLIASSSYSIGSWLECLGISWAGLWKQLLIGLFVLAGAITAIALVPVTNLLDAIRQLILVSAVVAASWSGLILSDSLLRRTGYHEVSLTREYGFYGKVNWVNNLGFLVAIALGLGFIEPQGSITSWTGYLAIFTPGFFDALGGFLGIAMAFGVSMLFPVLFGIPRIRKQELAHLELEQRRIELKEFLESVD